MTATGSGVGLLSGIAPGVGPSPPASAGETAGVARTAVPLPRWAREFWFFGILAGAKPASRGKVRARSAGHPNSNLAARLNAMTQGSSAGGRMAIFLGLCHRPGECDRCGRRLVAGILRQCDRCGSTLCGPPCATPCHRTVLGLVSGCTAWFCGQCEPGHSCSRGASLGSTAWGPLPDTNHPAAFRRVGSADRATGVRSSSSPPGGAGRPPLSAADGNGEISSGI